MEFETFRKGFRNGLSATLSRLRISELLTEYGMCIRTDGFIAFCRRIERNTMVVGYAFCIP